MKREKPEFDPGSRELIWICKRKARPDRHRKRWPRLRVINGEFVVMSEVPTPA
jgi:hypothetical protein